MQARALIWIVLLVTILGGGGFAYYQYNRELPDLTDQPAEVTLTAVSLYQAFEADEAGATEEYLGKVIELSGQIMEKQTTPDESIILLLEAGDGLGVVNCGVNAADLTPAVKNLQHGDQVTIRGMCDGYVNLLSQVNLSRCTVISPK